MKLLLLTSTLFLFVSCNGSSSGSGKSPSITSGSSTIDPNRVVAQNYVSGFNKNLPHSVQISNDDLAAWKNEGLLEASESEELATYLK